MTPKQIETMYERLPTLVVELSPDPTALGPLYLQNLISKVRGYLNETGVYLQRVLKAKSDLESELESQEVAFQISSDELLAGDKRVTRLPAIRDREAMINLILRDDRKSLLELKKRVNDMGYVEKAVRHRHRELEHTMSAIRLQRSLIVTELKTGSLYGDEGEESRGSTWGRKAPNAADNDIDEEEIERLMEEAEQNDESGDDASESDPEPEDDAEGEDEPEDDEPEEDEEDEPEDEDDDEPEEDEPDEDDEPEDEPEPDEDIENLLGDLEDLDDDVSLGGSDTLVCSVCGEPQKETESGLVCAKGHGAKEPSAKEEPEPETDPGLDASDLFGEPESVPTDPVAAAQEVKEAAKPAKDEPEDPDIASFLDDDEDFSDIFAEMDKDN